MCILYAGVRRRSSVTAALPVKIAHAMDSAPTSSHAITSPKGVCGRPRIPGTYPRRQRSAHSVWFADSQVNCLLRQQETISVGTMRRRPPGLFAPTRRGFPSRKYSVISKADIMSPNALLLSILLLLAAAIGAQGQSPSNASRDAVYPPGAPDDHVAARTQNDAEVPRRVRCRQEQGWKALDRSRQVADDLLAGFERADAVGQS